jgi:hypothetical protein
VTDAQRIARELVKRLVASEKLVLVTPRDEDQLPALLEGAFEEEDDAAIAAAIGERLTDAAGVADLFASDEEIAALLAEVR